MMNSTVLDSTIAFEFENHTTARKTWKKIPLNIDDRKSYTAKIFMSFSTTTATTSTSPTDSDLSTGYATKRSSLR
jgi:hypothetical protein